MTKVVFLRGISVKIVSAQLAEESGSLTAVGIIPPWFTERQTHTSLCKQAVVNYCDMLRQFSVLGDEVKESLYRCFPINA